MEHEDRRDFHMACWEVEFLPVAQKLMTFLQPPDHIWICMWVLNFLSINPLPGVF